MTRMSAVRGYVLREEAVCGRRRRALCWSAFWNGKLAYLFEEEEG